jgi:hypothetical protein
VIIIIVLTPSFFAIRQGNYLTIGHSQAIQIIIEVVVESRMRA